MDFKKKFEGFVADIDRALEGYVQFKDLPEGNIYNTMKYSLMAGGKRLRPVLSMAVAELLDGNREEVIPFACAIEMIHTYSLIHDDLPCMDNDDLRRGRPTSHKVFGEGMAVLTGDALLNYAFEVMLHSCINGCSTNGKNIKLNNAVDLSLKIKAMNIIAEAAGVSGMIGGQVVDLESEGEIISKDKLTYMHKCKTGALIKSAVMSAAVMCNANPQELEGLERYSKSIGLAFQIKDDILDVEGELEILGKPIGSDNHNKKSTFVTLYGIDESKKMLTSITSKALDSLEIFSERADFLKNLARYLLQRQK